MSSSLGRNSLIMAAGTAASRVTGQVRTILLAAALGTTGLAANAYQAGAMIPQAVFALVSGGIFNAVLVPQIVRTLQQDDAEERLNKLITLAISLLALMTVVMAAATPLLTMLYVDGTPEMLALTNAFTLWCMPQIFFYGLYTVLGQVLAAKDHFGAYAWSSVGANVISCAGFTAFILLFGRATEQPMGFWTGDKLMLTAGTWTLGVAFQALILFVPLTKCGIRYRPRWGLHGIGLRSMGSVAGWSVAIVVVDQVASLLATRITTSAPGAAHARLGLDMVEVAGNATYQNAFTLYMLPYSLIAVSVATALFPRISRAIADHDIDGARSTLSLSLRSMGVLMMFFTAAFIVMPVPIIIALLPSVSMHEATLIAAPLMTLGLGLPISSAYLVIQRTFYSFEDGRNPFLFMLLFNVLFIGSVFGLSRVTPPTQWVMLVGAGSALGHLVAFPFLIPPLRARFEGRLDGRRIAWSYGQSLVAGAAAVIVGLLARDPVYSLLGVWSPQDAAAAGSPDAGAAGHGRPITAAQAMNMNWFQAIGACVLLTIVITVVYVGVLWLLRSRELMMAVDMVKSRLTRRPVAPADPEPAATAAADVPPAPPAQTRESKPAQSSAQPMASTTPTIRMTPKPSSESSSQYGVGMKPQLGDTIINRYTLVSPLRNTPGLQAWKANDRMLAQDCQVFVITDRRVVTQVNDVTSILASMHDQRLTQVLQLHHSGELPIIVTREDAGLSLSDYLRGPARKILSYAAIRSILGETTLIVRTLLARGVVDHAISTDTVRISAAGVQLADIPVSMMLQDVSGRTDDSTGDEERAVRQLAALLYSLLNGTPSNAHTEYDMSRLNDDIPGEFKLICRRGLGLHGDNGTFNAPMSSLAEIDALLGAWYPLNQLMEHDIALPSIAGTASIMLAAINPTPQDALMEIPAGMVNTNPLPPLSLNTPKYASALTSDDVVDVTPLTGDLFSAFDGQHTDGNGAALPTVPLNVSSVRHNDAIPNPPAAPAVQNVPGYSFPVSDAVSRPTLPLNPIVAGSPTAAAGAGAAAKADDIEATQTLPAAVAPPVAPPPVADPALEATQVIDPVKNTAPDPNETVAMPPITVKTAVTRPDKIANAALNADVADETLMIGLPTKIITVLVGIAVVVGAGYFAVRALNNAATGNVGGGSSSQADPWKDNLNDVPFGNTTNGEVSGSDDSDSSDNSSNGSSSSNNSSSSSSDKSSSSSGKSKVVTADKEAKKVPDPKYHNDTPVTIASQSFLSSPAGQSGFAYHLHLNEATKVYRLKITISTSGGKAYVRTGTTDDPTKGKQVADFTFAEGGTTEVKFNSVVTTQDVMIWVPMDGLPNGQLYIQKVELF
ncbi:murein biosynthesis integral membrane protein MurJ [Bifidobacterium sp. SO1]|uniref:murein biosynthesis integral membrane protein MurJ n=1 Tax=Bifidobacterium sp. SO1 TaxID=2809029 RepID=UPI001BDD17CA|nr:murein biosynthesis integral membrane protein MurJ [Bifidobacterium sp. SO1]MBT1162266.1 murein biosynthesis integral membrane protein MurJ [Bifidobacterium sp. SO1]